jgi:hypothetical protein
MLFDLCAFITMNRKENEKEEEEEEEKQVNSLLIME